MGNNPTKNSHLLYIYRSHLGGLYVSDRLYNLDILYCEDCDDFDTYLGKASTRDEAKKLLKQLYGYWGPLEKKFVNEHWSN